MKKAEDLQRGGRASVEQNKIGRWVEYRLPEQKHLCAMMHAPRDTASRLPLSVPAPTNQTPAQTAD